MDSERSSFAQNTANLSPLTLMPFLRTILTPSLDILRTHVRTLCLAWQNFPAIPIDPAVLQIFHAAAQHHGLPQSGDMSNDSLVQLLLNLLPRVHTLHLSPPDDSNSYNNFFGATPTSVHLPLALRSVCHLSYTSISLGRGVSNEVLLTTLSLPNIDRLEVQLHDEIDDPFPAASSATSAVSKLHISYSQITLTSLARILAVPRALQQLSFTSDRTVPSINIDELHDALAPVRPTLEVLEVYLQPENQWMSAMMLQLPLRDSFQDWPMLRGLRCPMRLLLGDFQGTGSRHLWEVLPRGVCELEVCIDPSWGREEVVAEFVHLLHRKVDVVPCLRKAIVGLGGQEVYQMWQGNLVSLWRRLQILCEAVDVELVQEGAFYLVDQNYVSGGYRCSEAGST